jgi:hypothetical protein
LSGRAAALALFAFAPALCACAPTLHTLEPYRSRVAAARAIEARARESCAAGPEGPREPPAKPFVTDGCSLWIDGGWGEPCCVEHDMRYWCGGRAAARAQADAELRQCVDARSPAALAWLMWLGVRAGGHPIFPTWYRWGFGREYLPWYGEYPAGEGESAAEAESAP